MQGKRRIAELTGHLTRLQAERSLHGDNAQLAPEAQKPQLPLPSSPTCGQSTSRTWRESGLGSRRSTCTGRRSVFPRRAGGGPSPVTSATATRGKKTAEGPRRELRRSTSSHDQPECRSVGGERGLRAAETKPPRQAEGGPSLRGRGPACAPGTSCVRLLLLLQPPGRCPRGPRAPLRPQVPQERAEVRHEASRAGGRLQVGRNFLAAGPWTPTARARRLLRLSSAPRPPPCYAHCSLRSAQYFFLLATLTVLRAVP